MPKRKLETLKISSLVTELNAHAQRDVRGGWGKGNRDRQYFAGLEVTRDVDVASVRMAFRPLANGGHITTLPTRL